MKPVKNVYLKTPAIKVVGIGSGGNVVVNRMIASGIRGLEFINLDTNPYFLNLCRAKQKLQMNSRGKSEICPGEILKKVVEENKDHILKILKGADIVFIVAALGGSVGSSVAPLVAEAAGELNALTVGAVTKPLTFDRPDRLTMAEERISALKEKVDTLIVVSNDRLLQKLGKTTAVAEAFRMADEILGQGIRVISNMLALSALGKEVSGKWEIKSFTCNFNHSEIRQAFKKGGLASIGIGCASGKKRSFEAAKAAVSHCLLKNCISKAGSVMVNVTRGRESVLFDISGVLKIVRRAAGERAELYFSDTILDRDMNGEIKVTLIASRLVESSPAPKNRHLFP